MRQLLDVQALKESKSVISLLEAEGVTLTRRGANQVACCVLHDERTPSFTIFPDGGFKCFGCSASGGDVIDFLRIREGISFKEAAQMLGASTISATTGIRRITQKQKFERPLRRPTMPDDVRQGNIEDFKTVARTRKVSHISVATADKLGLLLFGTVKGFPSWILSDDRQLCAEARRLDGELYPPTDRLAERKVHTLPGSCKSWPVGLCPTTYTADDFRALMLVEGGPDLLAALHFLMRAQGDCLPVAVLGTSQAISDEALDRVRGKRVRIYPHVEENASGLHASERWAEQLVAVGCDVDCYSFRGLVRNDGRPVKDLNDAACIHQDQAGQLHDLLP